MQPVQPILIADLFLPLHEALVELLSGLDPEDWYRPTVAPEWTVKDLVAHLLDTDVRRLSYLRDGLGARQPSQPIQDYQALLEHINQLNRQWVLAAKRISPRLLLDFLSLTGPQVAEVFGSLDPFAKASAAVAWAGERESLNWFDTAREYTEKWTHQQQIREATGRPGLTARKWLHPVLDTFVRALPHTFNKTIAPAGTAVVVSILGEAGGEWSLIRKPEGWELYAGAAGNPRAQVKIDQDSAWRVFTKGLSREQARARAQIHGELSLGERVLDLIGMMV
ncbi:MAG: maleylpyruvate isomerase family mycothiol-dependent enzyme [Anaerolineales bacterium]